MRWREYDRRQFQRVANDFIPVKIIEIKTIVKWNEDELKIILQRSSFNSYVAIFNYNTISKIASNLIKVSDGNQSMACSRQNECH